MQIVRGKPGDTADSFGRIERLIEIDHESNIRPDQLANALDHPIVIGDVTVAALDLDAAKSPVERTLEVFLVSNRIAHAVTVIGADRPHRAAEQLGHWLTRHLAQRIPE